jgi:hypothetical protein
MPERPICAPPDRQSPDAQRREAAGPLLLRKEFHVPSTIGLASYRANLRRLVSIMISAGKTSLGVSCGRGRSSSG